MRLTADTNYSLVMDRFMSWQPGPFRLLYTSDVFATTMAPVPATWLTTTTTSAAEDPSCGGLAATIVGTDGPDFLVGTPDDDVIVAGPGNDRVHGRGGNDTICGNDGHDVLRGRAGDDEIHGGPGADRIWGGHGNDTISGHDGNDTVAGGVGADTMAGGDGHDTIIGTTVGRWHADPTAYRNGDHADGGHGSDRCLLVRPQRTTSCEHDTVR